MSSISSRFIVFFLLFSACSQTWAKEEKHDVYELVYDVLVAEFSGYRGNIPLTIKKYKSLLPKIKNEDFFKRAFLTANYYRDGAFSLKILQEWDSIENPSDDNLISHVKYAILVEDIDMLSTSAIRYYQLATLEPEMKLQNLSALLVGKVSEGLFKSIYEKIYMYDQKELQVHIAVISLAQLQKRPEDAISLSKQALTIFGNNVEIIRLYSQALRESGEIKRSKNVILNANLTYKQDPKLKYLAALILINDERLAEAIKELKTIARIEPTNWKAKQLLTSVLISDHKLRMQAKPYLFSLLSFPQASNYARYYLGFLAREAGDFDSAETHYREIYRGEKYLSARIELARIYQQTGKYENAEEELYALSEEMEDDQSIAVVFANLIQHYQLLKDFSKAREIVASSLDRFPKNQDLHYQSAMVSLDQGNVEQALSELWDIHIRDPENSTFLNAYGYTLADQTNRYEEAYEFIIKGYEKEPNNPAIIDSLGWVMYKMGRVKEALMHLQNAYSLEPDEEIGVHLVEVLRAIGKRSQANKLFKILKKKYPNSRFMKALE